MRTFSPFHGLVRAIPACLLALGCVGGCDDPTGATGGATTTNSATASASARAPGPDVLVTVNGEPIRMSDLHYVLAREKKGRGPAGEKEAEAVLQRLIDQEIARQEAVASGLDRDPEYLRRLRFMEAPVNDFKRTELRRLYLDKKVAEARVTDEEARRFFDDNRQRFQTVVQIHKILVRGDEAKIQKMKADIDAGTPFEEVAAQQFPDGVPEGSPAPWETGPLRWHLVPEPFADAAATMKEGEVSGILRGPKERAWIIKLVERRVDDSITFESVKPQLVALLVEERATELQAKALEELRGKARIVRVKKVEAMPAPPDPDE